jgi:hypothetical protein
MSEVDSDYDPAAAATGTETRPAAADQAAATALAGAASDQSYSTARAGDLIRGRVAVRCPLKSVPRGLCFVPS